MFKTSKFLISIAGSLLLLLAAMLLPLSKDRISVGNAQFSSPLSWLVKLTSLRARQIYFLTWYREIVAPTVEDPEAKIDATFRWIAEFDDVPTRLKDPNRNVEQHEYYTLIKQYGTTSEKVRTFCVLLTIAGHQAVPFDGEADGRVVVRVAGAEKWLAYDLRNKRAKTAVHGIALSREVKDHLKDVRGLFGKLRRGEYTRGEMNVLAYRVLFEIQKLLGGVTLIDNVSNERVGSLTP